MQYAAEARVRVTHRSDYWSTNQFAAEERLRDEKDLVARICAAESARALPAVVNVVNNRRKHGKSK